VVEEESKRIWGNFASFMQFHNLWLYETLSNKQLYNESLAINPEKSSSLNNCWKYHGSHTTLHESNTHKECIQIYDSEVHIVLEHSEWEMYQMNTNMIVFMGFVQPLDYLLCVNYCHMLVTRYGFQPSCHTIIIILIEPHAS
jgi:hypothetical protein